MRTVDAIKYHIPAVLAHYNLPPITGGKHYRGECPMCGKKNHYRMDNRDNKGTWICSCGNGDIWKLLQTTQQKDFRTLAKEIDLLIGNSYTNNNQPKQLKSNINELRNRVIKKFNNLESLKGTQAEKYLNNRHITLPTNVCNIKYSPSEGKGNTALSAIYALATDLNGNLCYLHRTLLNGDSKANITTPKKLNSLQDENYLTYAKSVAIRLFPVSSTLGIAEGIETALSCYQIYKCNTWSTINAAFLEKFIAPLGVKHLMIFADTDWNLTGQSAAFKCAKNNLLSIHNDVEKVTIRWPEKGDFNDVLIQGLKVYEWASLKEKKGE